MKVRVLAPGRVVLETDAAHVTVEDLTGSLGIRPGHAPLVTALARGILTVRLPGGRERHVAVNGGVMGVRPDMVEVVSRQAVASDDLSGLEDTALAQFEKEERQQQASYVAFEKMRIRFMRNVLEFERAAVD